jgi:2-polyprenyl-3-methyl-5-hydroxy-6-metoxy-1,4-benzoquinol methylase
MFAETYDKCPVCFGKGFKRDFSLEYQSYALRWDRCLSCGFTFMNPRLLPEKMYKIYTTPEYWSTAYRDYFDSESIRIENSILRFQLCERHIPQSGRLLDLACATGFFGAVAADRGFDVIGVDVNPEMIEFGRQRYGLDLRVSTVEDCEFQPDSFDIVSMWGVDSHFFDFRSTFAKIAGWLKPGGCILIGYQDYGHWIRLIFPKIKQEPNVYYNFTKDSFARFMRQLGMEVVMERTGVQVTQLHRVTSSMKLGLDFPVLGNLKIRISTPSYLIAVVRKELP